MSHTTREKQKLISRVRRIRGQMEGVERMLEEDKSCSEILQVIAGARGALN
ncbi:MAG: metal-sensing transcriptional repressor, partial [Rhizobiales bacterium]|nr:metal-sensing transcriptional repressor [Hyphomicrobiales bacterium]